jgi:ABC-2 type transport system permease protein
MFGVLMIVVLGLSLLVSPALAAQSVNGDRERGTLATLQVTRLGAGEIAVGKLLASWGTALVFLAVTLPLTAWCLAEGGLSVLRVAGVYLVMALLLGVVCAVALALSALLARTTTSSVLSYLLVFAATGGTALAFVLATALTQEHRTVHLRSCEVLEDAQGNLVDENGEPRAPGTPPIETNCHDEPMTTPVQRPDRTWWLLAPNPFVVLADSAPAAPTVTERGPDGRTVERAADLDPLGAMARALRGIRSRPVLRQQEFGEFYERPADGGHVWPFGLAVDVLVGAGALALAVRRLRTPTYRLLRGQRIA